MNIMKNVNEVLSASSYSGSALRVYPVKKIQLKKTAVKNS